jgi:hypothetical protein
MENSEVTFAFLIGAASDLIRRETGRRFGPRLASMTRNFRVSRGGTVYIDELLSEGDIISIEGPTGVTADWEYEPQDEDPDANLGGWITMGGEPWPYDLAILAPSHDGFFTRNMHPPEGAPRNWENSVIKVTGNFGYNKVPETISYLCARAVQIWWDTNVVNFDDSEEGNIAEPPDRLPQSVLTALRYFKKPRTGAAVLSGG